MDIAVTLWRLPLLLLLALSELSVVSPVSNDCSSTVMDLVVVADSSSSIKRADYRLMKEFLAKVVSGLPTDDIHVRMAIVRFSSKVDIILNLMQSETNDNLQKILTNMAFVEGGTNTYTALKTVRERILLPANGRRPEVPAVVLVVTDGESWSVSRTTSEAALLKNLDVNILTLGIGSNVSLSELYAISSGFVQHISDFDSLDGIVDILRSQLCQTAVDSISVRTTAIPMTSENRSSPALDSTTGPTIADDTSPPALDSKAGLPTLDETSSTALDSTTPGPMIADETSSPGLDSTPGPTIADDTSSPALDSKAAPWTFDKISSTALDSTTPGPSIADDTSSPGLDSTPGPTTFDKTSSPSLDSKAGPPTFDKTSSAALDYTPGPTIADDTSSTALDSNFTHVTARAAGLSTSDLRRCFEQRVDLVFVVDASYSVGTANFERAKSFINKIVSDLPIGQTTVRVALVRYDISVSIINLFLDSVEAVTDSVRDMTYPDVAGTNTGGALREVREKVFDVRKKEDGVKDIVITITDGESDEADVTEEQASLLREEGAQLVWLYIYKGAGRLEDEKNFMEEQGDSVIVVDHFDKLTDDIVSKMLVASCPDRTTPSTTTSTVLTMDLQTTNPPTAVASTEDDRMTTASVDSLISTAEQSVTVTEQPSITTESSVVSSSSSAFSIAESSTADIWFHATVMTSEGNPMMSPREEINVTAAHDAADLPTLTLSTILLGQRTTAVADTDHTATEQTNQSSTEEKDDDSALNHTTWTPPSSPAAVRMTSSSTEPTTTSQTAQQQSTTTEAKTSPSVTSATTHAGSTLEDFTSATEVSNLRESLLVSNGDKPWHNDWPLIVGVTAGVVGIAALSTGFLIFILRRRRQGTHDITPASAAS